MKIDTIGTRIESFLHSKFGAGYGSLKRTAEALGIDPSALQKYYKNQLKPGNAMQQKLRELGCDIEWLMTGKISGEKEVAGTVPLMNVPVYSHVNAGNKKWVITEDIVEYIGIPKSNDKTLFGIIVKGNSMHDEIDDGDIIILSAKAEIKSGELCVVEWEDGDKHLRRVTFDKNNIVLTSKNDAEYPPIITHKSKIRKLYRVMKHIRNY